MCNKLCEKCKYAEWDYVDAYRGGYWAINGCNVPIGTPVQNEEVITQEEFNKMEDWDEDWGIEKDCPFWVEVEEKDDYYGY